MKGLATFYWRFHVPATLLPTDLHQICLCMSQGRIIHWGRANRLKWNSFFVSFYKHLLIIIQVTTTVWTQKHVLIMVIKTLEVLTVAISSLVKVKGIFLGEGLFWGGGLLHTRWKIYNEGNKLRYQPLIPLINSDTIKTQNYFFTHLFWNWF